MSFIRHLEKTLREVVAFDDRPVVVSAAMWPLLKAMGRSDAAAVEEILDLLVKMYGQRGMLMPSFTMGFDQQGRCDLDQVPGNTGVLSELMRRRPSVVRTLSAWFSYIALGDCAREIENLLPMEAWGAGSLYEWMEERDVSFLMLGTHPTHCSYPHRLEWLARDVLDYRFNKTFCGILVRDGQERKVKETLFVRQSQPVEVVNDFTKMMPFLVAGGMRQATLCGVSVASYEASTLLKNILPVLRVNTSLLLSDNSKVINREIK